MFERMEPVPTRASTNYRDPTVQKEGQVRSVRFCVSQYYHYLLNVQMNPFQTKPESLQLRVSFRFL